jgi:hypothetical protein
LGSGGWHAQITWDGGVDVNAGGVPVRHAQPLGFTGCLGRATLKRRPVSGKKCSARGGRALDLL